MRLRSLPGFAAFDDTSEIAWRPGITLTGARTIDSGAGKISRWARSLSLLAGDV